MSVNTLQRVHERLIKAKEEINEYRKKNNMKKLTMTEITHGIARHIKWVEIKNDLAVVKDYKEINEVKRE